MSPDRKRRIRKLKAQVFDVLGRACTLCARTKDLEVDHVHGRNWDLRKHDQEMRYRKYLQEIETGVPLQVLCSRCNGTDGWYRSRKLSTYSRRAA